MPPCLITPVVAFVKALVHRVHKANHFILANECYFKVYAPIDEYLVWYDNSHCRYSCQLWSSSQQLYLILKSQSTDRLGMLWYAINRAA